MRLPSRLVPAPGRFVPGKGDRTGRLPWPADSARDFCSAETTKKCGVFAAERWAPKGDRESAEPAIGGDGDPHVRAVERSHFVEDIGGEDDEITRGQPEISGTQGKRGVQIFDGRVQVCARSLARVEEAQDCAVWMI